MKHPSQVAHWTEQRIFVFQTYIGAAMRAHKQCLIHAHGLWRVAHKALMDFRGMKLPPSDAKEQQRRALNADLAMALPLLEGCATFFFSLFFCIHISRV
jgi:hypothetical protein